MPRKKEKWIIKDWAGNIKFKGKEFSCFENADGYLTEQIEKMYPETKDDDKKFYEEKGEFHCEQI